MTRLSQRLAELGHTLPSPTVPVANFLSTTRLGDLLVVSGHIGHVGAASAGPVGQALSADEARAEAELAALALLAAIDAAVEGDIDRVQQVMRLGVFIAASPAFDQHSRVADGASNLVVAALGERGRHARTAVGVASLPAGAAVEVDALVRLRPDAKAASHD